MEPIGSPRVDPRHRRALQVLEAAEVEAAPRDPPEVADRPEAATPPETEDPPGVAAPPETEDPLDRRVAAEVEAAKREISSRTSQNTYPTSDGCLDTSRREAVDLRAEADRREVADHPVETRRIPLRKIFMMRRDGRSKRTPPVWKFRILPSCLWVPVRRRLSRNAKYGLKW